MVNFKKLAQVQIKPAVSATQARELRKRVMDSRRRRSERSEKDIEAIAQRIVDSALKERRTRVTRKGLAKFRVSDAYKNLRKKIKDALEETETTDEAIETSLQFIDNETPADQVLTAVIETLADTIDNLQEEDNSDEYTEEELDEVELPEDEAEIDEVYDSCRKKIAAIVRKRLVDSRK